MFLATTLQRNPALIRAAVALHQRRQVPPNTFLVDLEALRHNAGLLGEAAARHGPRLYGMTRQFGRHRLLAPRWPAGVPIAGVTSFPCLTYDEAAAAAIPTPNLATLRRAAELLRDLLGGPIEQLNAPGLTTSATIPLLAALGATHGEPGSSLVGHT